MKTIEEKIIDALNAENDNADANSGAADAADAETADEADLNEAAKATALNEDNFGARKDIAPEAAAEGAQEEFKEQKIGKFKNPQELLRAYGELEKEFTRRSQRLKELENGKQAPKTEEDWRQSVDKFFEEIPAAKAFAKDMAKVIISDPALKEQDDCLKVALLRVLTDKFRTPEQLMNDGEFLKNYVLGSDAVRNAVIADYMGELRRDMPPKTLANGGLQCVAPKVKPKTIEEAGFLFLKNNK